MQLSAATYYTTTGELKRINGTRKIQIAPQRILKLL